MFLKKNGIQVILLNNRRSSIWNRDSISLLKKTNSKVLSLEHILSKDDLKFLKHQKRKYLNILDELSKIEFVPEKFSIDGLTFWDELKFEIFNTYRKRIEWYLELIFGAKATSLPYISLPNKYFLQFPF